MTPECPDQDADIEAMLFALFDSTRIPPDRFEPLWQHESVTLGTYKSGIFNAQIVATRDDTTPEHITVLITYWISGPTIAIPEDMSDCWVKLTRPNGKFTAVRFSPQARCLLDFPSHPIRHWQDGRINICRTWLAQ